MAIKLQEANESNKDDHAGMYGIVTARTEVSIIDVSMLRYNLGYFLDTLPDVYRTYGYYWNMKSSLNPSVINDSMVYKALEGSYMGSLIGDIDDVKDTPERIITVLLRHRSMVTAFIRNNVCTGDLWFNKFFIDPINNPAWFSCTDRDPVTGNVI